MLVNLGEVPKQTYPNRLPTTRMGTAGLVRTALAKAQGYARKREAEPDKRPPLDPKSEALIPVLDGKVPVVFSAHRADDLATALRHLRGHGVRASDIAAIPAAAGGPNGLALNPLDRYLFDNWLAGTSHTVHLLGASIGAWRMASACLPDPAAAL